MFKDLMVQLDGTEEDEIRLAHAESIAARFQAHLTGLSSNPIPEYRSAFVGEPGYLVAETVIELEERVRAEADVALARLKDRFTRIGVPSEVRNIVDFASEVPGLVTSEARWADLFVASAPYRNSDSFVADRIFEAVLFGAGHAIYVVPPKGRVRGDLRNVIVAWKDTRESARGVAEALPFLRASTGTRIVTVDAEGERGEAAIDIAGHLDRHGVNVEITALEAGNRTVAEVLVDEARKMSADLIVMGAYGHSRFREWILGGATREMLETSDVPMLIAH
jgi:nucleotide-binding universal stress UspA family protein